MLLPRKSFHWIVINKTIQSNRDEYNDNSLLIGIDCQTKSHHFCTVDFKHCKMENTKQIILSKTENGKVFKCLKCNLLHIEYKNLNFNFSPSQYDEFIEYINELEGEEWEYKNRNTLFNRKIFIPIGARGFNALFNHHELNEFKNLLNNQKQEVEIAQKIEVVKFNFSTALN